ncbi:cupin domain-containing protein [Paenibacillus sp. PDC88]|uniref:cupin domain-containing protein n=1 Tax=Paenibacillus sp. PDC88 TaxID=1884375 RepID=UPI000898FD00|nr:cupin domain-containing protein [Paenibacillus sp. PDC88]SDX56210.1 Cupin domain-containing protein [Paenibacillus sp. PDC88]
MIRTNLKQYQEYQEHKFTKRIIHKEKDNVIFLLNFSPGAKLPAHQHPNAHVYILVLDGEGVITSNGSDLFVKSGDVIHIDGEEMMSYQNGEGSHSSLYVVLTKIPSEQYTVNI